MNALGLLIDVMILLCVLDLVCLLALLVLVIIPSARDRFKTRQDARRENTAQAEWSSVDLLSRG